MPTMGRRVAALVLHARSVISASRCIHGRGLPTDHFVRRIAGHTLGTGVEDGDEAVLIGGDDGHLGGPIENTVEAGI